MTVRRLLKTLVPYSLPLAVTGFGLVALGFGLLPAVRAQDEPRPTPYVSMFDSPAQASPAAAAEVTPEAAATTPAPGTNDEPTVQATQSAPEVQAQPTRFGSIFDAPGESETSAEPAGEPAEPGPQPSRVGSIFDAAPPGAETTGQATQVPSIFDSQPPAPSGGQTGGVTSIFDSQPPPDAPGTGQTGGVSSIFDTMQADVIRYEGEEPPDAEYCLGCHEVPGLQLVLESGEVLPVTVNGEDYAESVHGQHGTEGYRCIRCHEGMNEYPHEPVEAETIRDLEIDMSTSCARCHTDKYYETLDDVHVTLLADGNQDAAVCSDCHSAHEVERLTDETTGQYLPGAKQVSASMCATCHGEIYDRYASSVHGAALLEGSADVPACADCHGIHSTTGPSTPSFRLFSPQTCAECHADETLMAQYDISTDVFDTYVADFHGTTVAIFQATEPDQDFNEPVCADCHGVHDIAAISQEDSHVLRENLVSTCQRCHPDATSNFPEAWMSHYAPSFERTPLVAFASLAYTIAIPAVVGGLGLFVLTDIRRRRSERRKDR